MRAFVRETRLHPRQLVAPMFVQPGREGREPVGSMPGVMRVTPDEALKDARALAALGIGGVILFGLPADKDAVGTGGWIADGIVQETLRRFRDADLDLVLIADTCLCEYTDHGHCGPLLADGRVDNDATIELYARTAASQAEAGADIVAPSGMMDGQVAAIRAGLDEDGHEDVAILAYAAKTASAFYGPFRDAAGSTPVVRRSPRLPDGPGQRPGVHARDRRGHRRGRGHAADQARDAVAGHPRRRPRPVRRAHRGLPGQRRVRLHRGRRAARLAGPATRPDRVHHLDPARRRGLRDHATPPRTSRRWAREAC